MTIHAATPKEWSNRNYRRRRELAIAWSDLLGRVPGGSCLSRSRSIRSAYFRWDRMMANREAFWWCCEAARLHRSPIAWAYTPEQGRTGLWHVHALLAGTPPHIPVACEMWKVRNGHIHVQAITDVYGATLYASKSAAATGEIVWSDTCRRYVHLLLPPALRCTPWTNHRIPLISVPETEVNNEEGRPAVAVCAAHELPVYVCGARGRRRVRVTECWSQVRAEDVYTALLKDDAARVAPGPQERRRSTLRVEATSPNGKCARTPSGGAAGCSCGVPAASFVARGCTCPWKRPGWRADNAGGFLTCRGNSTTTRIRFGGAGRSRECSARRSETGHSSTPEQGVRSDKRGHGSVTARGGATFVRRKAFAANRAFPRRWCQCLKAATRGTPARCGLSHLVLPNQLPEVPAAVAFDALSPVGWEVRSSGRRPPPRWILPPEHGAKYSSSQGPPEVGPRVPREGGAPESRARIPRAPRAHAAGGAGGGEHTRGRARIYAASPARGGGAGRPHRRPRRRQVGRQQ